MMQTDPNDVLALAIKAKREAARWESAVEDFITKEREGTFDDARKWIAYLRPQVERAR